MRSSENFRCAIYTRKSTERGLDMNVTSLEAQRDVCRSYIKCQAHRKWTEVSQAYDDGGYSGGTLERPGLRQLINDVEHGQIDVIIIYKIDRLTRSLLDFVRLIEVLERHDVSFVSVTQAFDTSDSMGRLILNVLLTFAQFERELMSDRVRDKKAAMQRKGYFAGGLPPFGYLVDSGGRLCLDDERAPIVRELFQRYADGTNINEFVNEFRAQGCVTRRYVSLAGREHGGQPITTAIFRHILQNPIYTGHIVHRGEWIEAQIDPLVTRALWDVVQEGRARRAPKPTLEQDFLISLLYDSAGRRMKILRNGPGQRNPYRYYHSEAAGWSRGTEEKSVFVRADEIEQLVRTTLLVLFRDRARLNAAVMAGKRYSNDIRRLQVRGNIAARRLECMDPKQFRQALVALAPRIEISRDQLKISVSCSSLVRFLAWDGAAGFSRNPADEDGLIYELISPACLVLGHPRYSLPIGPRMENCRPPSPELVELIRKAVTVRDAVHANRDRSLVEVAAELRMTQSRLVRLLRVNYLAPDIQTAVLDGAQPRGLTMLRLLDAAMVLDWKHQRDMLGFPPQD